MYVLSLCFHTVHLPFCCVHVCGYDCVFLDVITTEIVKMRRSTRKKNPNISRILVQLDQVERQGSA